MKQKTEDRRQRTDPASLSASPRRAGSAIILAIVLTTLLAIVAVLFLLSSRVDMVGTSAVADNENLELAVDTVIAKISEELALDVPGNSGQEYYDYPDINNTWLASLEPNNSSWPHITDINNQLGFLAYNLIPSIIDDYQQDFEIGDSNNFIRFPADADGDGVSDSAWIKVPGLTSSKGKPVFAAVRIIDNGGMLNVNTGYQFDANTSDGSSQLNVNIMSFSWRPPGTYIVAEETDLRVDRSPVYQSEPQLPIYEQGVIWKYGTPDGNFTPFDVSDELEMRNRFVLNHKDIDTRLENWGGEFRNAVANTPYSSVAQWFLSAYDSGVLDQNYAYRHIATTYNYDRIIASNGGKMLNINRASGIDPSVTRDTIAAALIAGGVLPADANAGGAQIAANLIDYVDDDSNVIVVYDTANNPHFGFEQPCIYISELAQNFIQPDANDPNIVWKSFAIELFKPYAEDPYPQCPGGNCLWQLVIFDSNSGNSITFPFSWSGPTWSGTGQFFVFENDSFNFIEVTLADYEANSPHPLDGAIGVRPDVNLSWPSSAFAANYDVYFGTDQSAIFNATRVDANVYQGNVDTNTYDPPGLLNIDTTYFWRIDPVTGGGSITKGPVWRFTVSDVNVLQAPVVFDGDSIVMLQRKVYDPCLNPIPPHDISIIVDGVDVPTADINEPNWLKPVVRDPNDPNVKFETHSFQRDITPHKSIRRFWGFGSAPTVGYFNNYVDGDSRVIQAHPANKAFTNVGEFGQLFYRTTYDYGGQGPWVGITEPDMRIDLTLPVFQGLFSYLTVFDPTIDGIDNDGDGAGTGFEVDPNELKIKGRININTAPWFVIAQLPWITDGTPSYELARAIVAYRDKLAITVGPDYSNSRQLGMGAGYLVREDRGFASIGELMNVTHGLSGGSYGPQYDIRKYAAPATMDLSSLPDLTPSDSAANDFEERDVIFSRISNLVTVRSDVFTAYILVRIGQDGPQKRIVAILDRSETPAKPVKVIAIQQVPDPR